MVRRHEARMCPACVPTRLGKWLAQASPSPSTEWHRTSIPGSRKLRLVSLVSIVLVADVRFPVAPSRTGRFSPLHRTVFSRPGELRPNLLLVRIQVLCLSLITPPLSLTSRTFNRLVLISVFRCLTCVSIGISGTLTLSRMPSKSGTVPSPVRRARRRCSATLVLLVVHGLVSLNGTRLKASRPVFPLVTLAKLAAARPRHPSVRSLTLRWAVAELSMQDLSTALKVTFRMSTL